jgi:hypothetical protein
MSLLGTFPFGDPEVLISFFTRQYPGAPFVANDEINLVFARNIVSYFNSSQQALIPQQTVCLNICFICLEGGDQAITRAGE